MTLRHIHVETTMFDPGDNVEQTRKDLCWWLEALTQRNQDYLRQRPSTPRLYKSGVKYALPNQHNGECEEARILREALGSSVNQYNVRKVLEQVQDVFGGEHFCDIGVILELGSIDCDGLACWRAAELRQSGIAAKPWMTHRSRFGGGTIYHALVRWPPIPTVPYETSEDPSLLLGMGGESRVVERAEEIRKNAERCEILQKNGLVSTNTLDSMLEDVLGLRRSVPSSSSSQVVSEIDQLLKRRGV